MVASEKNQDAVANDVKYVSVNTSTSTDHAWIAAPLRSPALSQAQGNLIRSLVNSQPHRAFALEKSMM